MTTFFFFLKVGKNDLPNIIFFFNIWKTIRNSGSQTHIEIGGKIFPSCNSLPSNLTCCHPIPTFYRVWIQFNPHTNGKILALNSFGNILPQTMMWRLKRPSMCSFNQTTSFNECRAIGFWGTTTPPPPPTHDILYDQKAQSKRMWVILQVKSLYHFLNLHICM